MLFMAQIMEFTPAKISDSLSTICDTSSQSRVDTTAILIKEEGFVGIPRQHNNSYDSSLLLFLVFSLFISFVAIGKHKISIRKVISNKEESKDEVRHTIIDLIITILLCITTIILSSILLIYITSDTVQPILPLRLIGEVAIGVTLFLAAQYIVIWLIGELFFTRNEKKQFLKENIISYTIPAIILPPFVLLVLLLPWMSNVFIYSAISLLFITRIIFIFKNIENFKRNIGTTCYIILYLCTVEIMPLMVLYKWVLNI